MEKLEITVLNGQIIIGETAEIALRYYGSMKRALQDAEIQEKEIKNAILQAMEENGIKKFENDFVSITYKAGSKRKTIDAAKLKDAGIYDDYTKESTVAPSLVVTYKE